jgi:hypothetical protein
MTAMSAAQADEFVSDGSHDVCAERQTTGVARLGIAAAGDADGGA